MQTQSNLSRRLNGRRGEARQHRAVQADDTGPRSRGVDGFLSSSTACDKTTQHTTTSGATKEGQKRVHHQVYGKGMRKEWDDIVPAVHEGKRVWLFARENIVGCVHRCHDGGSNLPRHCALGTPQAGKRRREAHKRWALNDFTIQCCFAGGILILDLLLS